MKFSVISKLGSVGSQFKAKHIVLSSFLLCRKGRLYTSYLLEWRKEAEAEEGEEEEEEEEVEGKCFHLKDVVSNMFSKWQQAKISLRLMCNHGSHVHSLPDEPFSNFRASKSVVRPILFRSGTSCNGFQSSKIVEGLVGSYTLLIWQQRSPCKSPGRP